MKGQLPLIDRGRFCPGRDCSVPCGVPGFACKCRPCGCTRCRTRARCALRGRRLPADTLPALAPRQPRLFFDAGGMGG